MVEKSATKESVLNYVRQKYGIEPEYLWIKSPDSAALRHKENRKWFGVVMKISARRLGINADAMVDILDVKCDLMTVDFLRDKSGFLPAYHMNKTYWITVILDGGLSMSEVAALIDESFRITE